MEVHEKGCSQLMSGCWAQLASSIGSIFQIGEESNKNGISKYCESWEMHVIHAREILKVLPGLEGWIPMEDPHWESL